MPTKQRLDVLVYERGLAPSREKARAMIMAGEILVNGHEINKPASQVMLDAELTARAKPRFVSRGGDKLVGALNDFKLDVKSRIAADVGASTGGFTDCLLQNQVAKVYAIDVGYGQLDYTLRQDDRVVVLERTNARYLDSLPEPINLVVIDASFISLKLLLPIIKGWLAPQADIVALIKPQFEAGREDVGKGGVVRDEQIHGRVLQEIASFAEQTGYIIADLTVSPLKGPAGNREFFIWLMWNKMPEKPLDIDARISTLIHPG
jgi:23S rRNA (cytidine1920-2'-O)/16S rRNA (cytidine1409-2'-O)-methyltransferase